MVETTVATLQEAWSATDPVLDGLLLLFIACQAYTVRLNLKR